MSKQNTLIIRIEDQNTIDRVVHGVLQPRLQEIFESGVHPLVESPLYLRTVEMDEEDQRVVHVGNGVALDYREYESSTHSYLLKIKWLQQKQAAEPAEPPLDLYLIQTIQAIIISAMGSGSDSSEDNKSNSAQDGAQRLAVIQELMEAQFGAGYTQSADGGLATVKVGDKTGSVDLAALKVLECDSSLLKGRLEGVLRVAEQLARPLIA